MSVEVKGFDDLILDFDALERATLSEQWEVTRAAAEAAARVEAQMAATRFHRRTGQLAGSIVVLRKIYTGWPLAGEEHALVLPDYTHQRADAYLGIRHTAEGSRVYKRSRHGTMTRGTKGHYAGTNMEIAAILHHGTRDGRLPKTGWMTDAAKAASVPAVAAAKRAYRAWLAKHWARRAP